MEANKIFKIILCYFCFLLTLNASAQLSKYRLLDPSASPKTITLHLIVDGKEVGFYPDMLASLSSVPLSELDDAIIYELIETKLYQNVEVEKRITDTGEIIFIAYAATIKRVQEIVILGLNSSELPEYLRIISAQRGQPFNESILNSDAEKIRKNLVEHGYLNANIKAKKVNELSTDYVQIIFEVEKNNPCHVDQVVILDSYANSLNFITAPIETGTVCDLKLIRESLDIARENYLEQGYLQAKVELKNISYSENKESAKLSLEIEKGPRTTFQIYDQDTGILMQDFLQSGQRLTYSDLILMSDADLVSILSNFYQKEGYAFPVVSEPEKIVDNKGNTVLKFLVKKGPLVKVGTVTFIGQSPEDDQKVLEYIGLKPSFFSTGIPFFRDNIGIYRDKLRNFYLEEGYADVQVANPDFIPTADKKQMDLIFRIEKGSKYIIDQLTVEGLPDNFKVDQARIDSILQIASPISAIKRKMLIDEYRRQLLVKGYLYNQVNIYQEIIATQSLIKKVSLKLVIQPGSIVRIRKIFVDSDIIGKDSAIISASNLAPGDVFSQDSFDNARVRLLKHDLFSSIYVEALDISALERRDTRIDIIIHARLKSGFSLGLSPQWSTFRGYIFALDFTLNKLNDDGLRFFSNASISQEKQQQTFASAETQQILGRNISLGLSESLFKLGPLITPLDVSTTFGYQVAAETLTNREYFTAAVATDWKPSFFDLNWNFRQAFIYEKSESTSSESAIVQTLDSPSVTIKELVSTVTLDTRNNDAWPTAGSLINLQYGLARFGLGSQVQFNRINFSYDTFFPIYRKLSAGISFGGKFILDTVNEDGLTVTPPASRRATLTESALVRGFPETYGNTAPGPLLWIHYQNNGVANCNTQLASLGATNLLYLKAESRYRMNDFFGVVLFVDSATNFFTQRETNQINALINDKIKNLPQSTTQCVPDNASLITPEPVRFQDANFLEQYWQQAYLSTGVGLRLIVGNYVTIRLDYGYPLKEPSSDPECVSPAKALSESSPPKCVTRIQDSFFTGFIKFRGAIHFNVGAQF